MVSEYATPLPPLSKFSASTVPGRLTAVPRYGVGVEGGGVGGVPVSGSMTMLLRFQPERTALTRINCVPAVSERPPSVISWYVDHEPVFGTPATADVRPPNVSETWPVPAASDEATRSRAR